MAKKKKKQSKATCPECGGSKRGRGYAHSANCSRKTGKAKASKKSGKASRTQASGIDGRMLRGMGVGELLALRDKVNEALGAKAPKIDAEIERLKQLKSSIGKA